ncbi:hypothetical protein PG996_002054 [Apiospora saccharicola]|uniref:Uncharacterized protein n=1 Tax=Apiospora saccharicola TaxID=335842 RepID=A0ABR1WII5_9PEZI
MSGPIPKSRSSLTGLEAGCSGITTNIGDNNREVYNPASHGRRYGRHIILMQIPCKEDSWTTVEAKLCSLPMCTKVFATMANHFDMV